MGRSSSSSSSSKSAKRKREAGKKRRSASSSSRASAHGKKSKRASKRSRSRSRSRANKMPQSGRGGPQQMFGYGGMPGAAQQMFMPGMWPGNPPPWAMVGSPAAQPQTEREKEKKDKKDKKEKKVQERDAEKLKKLEVESAEKMQSLQVENEKLKEQLSERDAAAETQRMRIQAFEVAEKQMATREQQLRNELRAYAKQLNTKNGEMRQLQEAREKHGSEIKDLQAVCASERKKRKEQDAQIAHLVAARESLLTGMRKLKEQYSAMKAQVKKLDVNGTLASVLDAPAESLVEQIVDGTGLKVRKGAALAAGRTNGHAPGVRLQKAPRPHSEPEHREAFSGPSCLGKKGASARKERICFQAGEGLTKEVKIRSYAGLEKGVKRTLWTPKAGSTLACDACSIRVPLAQGNLQLDPTRSQFMQERFLCSTCSGETASRPALNLLLADAPAAAKQPTAESQEVHAEAATGSPADAPAAEQSIADDQSLQEVSKTKA